MTVSITHRYQVLYITKRALQNHREARGNIKRFSTVWYRVLRYKCCGRCQVDVGYQNLVPLQVTGTRGTRHYLANSHAVSRTVSLQQTYRYIHKHIPVISFFAIAPCSLDKECSYGFLGFGRTHQT